MPHYQRPTNEQEFDANFAQKKPLMNDTEAYYESARCLYCYDAPCVQACPTGIDIPLFIKQIHTGNTEGAARTIYDQNWLGNACGTVCPTGVLCEGACVYNHQQVKPLQIGRLQHYATHRTMAAGKKPFSPGPSTGRRVAIVGAGPAGIACACELRLLGHHVDVFEAKAQPSGLTMHGVAPYKITNEEALLEVEWLREQLGFGLHCGQAVDEAALRRLEQEYDAIFLGIGLGGTASLRLPGETLEGVHGAVEWIEELRLKQAAVSVPNRVVVLGGGNTAMDAASEAARMGAQEVVLAYRRGHEHMGAYAFEYETAVQSGARGMFWAVPLEIVGENGRVAGIRLAPASMENGRLAVREAESFVHACEVVIKATGQAKLPGLCQAAGIALDGGGRISVHPETFQTSNPRYFAGGDAVNGGAEVVNAAHDGKQAAQGMHQWMMG
jgi:glutamate synthase (NADPH/NADH) small chain